MSENATDPGPRVLLVDDDTIQNRLATSILGRSCRVRSVTSGFEALEALEDSRFDVLVSDLRMEGMAGLELLRRCRERFPDMACLMLTGTADRESVIEALREGAYDFLLKPVSPEVLSDSVSKAWALLKTQRQNRELLIELDRTNRELRENRAQTDAMVENAPDPILSIDRHGRIATLNTAALQLFGIDREQKVELNFNDLVRSPLMEELLVQVDQGTSSALEGSGKKRGGAELRLEISARGIDHKDMQLITVIVRDVTERALREMELRRLSKAVEQVDDTIVITDLDGKIVYANPAFETCTGYQLKDALGQNPRFLQSGQHDRNFYDLLWKTILSGKTWSGQFINRKKDGTLFNADATISPVLDESGNVTNFVCVTRDVTHQRELEAQLNQAQKLESIGQLAAGIAHEINTPIQYVGDNVNFLEEAIEGLFGLLNRSFDLLNTLPGEPVPLGAVEELRQAAEEADLEYMKEEIPTALAQSKEGVRRVSEIVRGMKEFSHPGSDEVTPTDLNRAIRSTATVARNEWKYAAELETELDEELALVPCLPGELNQVILNLIINAAHAIQEKLGESPDPKGTIKISTHGDGNAAEIRISDTGCGVPDNLQTRIFDPFFTTKEVGKGTGQGLSIAHSMIVKKLGGTLTCESVPGEGATFIIRLPMEAKAPQPEEVPV